ncbi:MAG: hypothetical protein KAH10_05620 [Flavobacteriales bacterium]|nr:hypothetical protein [Flavobacteriales bacterium]
MKKFIYTIAAASMMFTSCVKDEIYTPPKAEEMVVSKIEYSETPDLSDIKVKVEYESAKEITEARIYYRIDGEAYTKDNKVKGEDEASFTQSDVTIDLTGIDGVQIGTEISFYVRLTYVDATEEFFVGKSSNIDKITEDVAKGDDVTALNQMEVGGTSTIVEVTPTEGPVTKITFDGKPAAGGDIIVNVEYTSTDEITEARLYYDVGDAPEYVKDNKVKGEKDDSFTQSGVSINLAGKVAVNGGATDASGSKVSFYIRISTAKAEYYYANDGTMHIDETPGGGTKDESDAFKSDSTLWNVYNVQ